MGSVLESIAGTQNHGYEGCLHTSGGSSAPPSKASAGLRMAF